MNVTQGDISLCCRGMRQQVGGYKFRFVAEEARPEAKLKRGFAYEPVLDEGSKDLLLAETRRTRASRGEFGATGGEAPAPLVPKISILAPPELKVSSILYKSVTTYKCSLLATAFEHEFNL